MGKVKLNLVSGAVVEKPLLNAFTANNSQYVVLDNEINGSMGLPIILVCKYENNRLVKIIDQNEWQIVKEYLKNIIAGNQVTFINVPLEMPADDIYYTQLTLPVPSFDALKNAYVVSDNSDNNISSAPSTEDASILDINPTINNDIVNNNVNNVVGGEAVKEEVNPTLNINPNPVVEQPVMPTIENQPSVEPVNTNPVIDINPVINNEVGTMSTPTVDVTPNISPVSPIGPVSPVEAPNNVVQEPEITPTPVINPVMPENEVVNNESIFKEQKEAFMQACENMFDALVQKFEKELEKNK